MDGSCSPQHRQHISHHHHGDSVMTEADRTNHPHAVLTDTVWITLLAGASAFCLSRWCWLQKDGKEKAQMILSEDNAAWCQRCLGATRGIRLEKCDNSSHRQCRHIVWMLMSRSYSAGNLERGRCLYASMWQCDKGGCQNANKATSQLHGTSQKRGVSKV